MGRTVAAASWCFDDHSISGLCVHTRSATQGFIPVSVYPDLAREAADESEWGVLATIGEDRDPQRREHLVLANQSIAAWVRTRATISFGSNGRMR